MDLLKFMPPGSWLPVFLFFGLAVIVGLFGWALILRFKLNAVLGRVYGSLRQKLLSNNNASLDQDATDLLDVVERSYNSTGRFTNTVNTVALVQKAYTNSLRLGNRECDWVEGVTGTMPGLLLVIGLFVTVLGILSNLLALGNLTALLGGGGNAGQTAARLQEPLQGIAVAFLGSAVALFCSVVLATCNLFTNTRLRKEQILDLLEDYADNFLQPRLRSSQTEEMTAEFKQLKAIISAVGVEIGDSIKHSLGEQVKLILEDNNRVVDVARQVYQNLIESTQELRGSVHASVEELQKSDFPSRIAQAAKGLNQFMKAADALNQYSTAQQQVVAAQQQAVDALCAEGSQVRLTNQQLEQIWQRIQGLEREAVQELTSVGEQLQDTLAATRQVLTHIEVLQSGSADGLVSLTSTQRQLGEATAALGQWTERMATGGGFTEAVSRFEDTVQRDDEQRSTMAQILEQNFARLEEILKGTVQRDDEQRRAAAQILEQNFARLEEIRERFVESAQLMNELAARLSDGAYQAEASRLLQSGEGTLREGEVLGRDLVSQLVEVRQALGDLSDLIRKGQGRSPLWPFAR
ncbi:MAG: hypothetical protein H7Y22_14520 [Gemmatimonadaceae bacterium]|nr:hypothetical protein [Gloeobacterales cyanobacterium ES-bin-141]